ncbi:MAG: hypothetical protein LJE61_08600 [Thiocapsa sp.]|jgi:hypothetical protein|nr:hypothetical protein [Thiocapsa sp.]MCG6898082.1 hypothetical protein [Thiocapsa sp.]MCG6985241.1 hypothetical protein [Thiocapsa sp.]
MALVPRSLLLASALLAGAGLASADQTVAFLDFESGVPDDWVAEPPKSQMRQVQFRIPAAEGEGAEFVVYYFGSGQGGTLEANIERWKSQFQGPDGTPVEPEVSEIGTEAIPATLVQLRGSYGRSVGMGPSDEVLADRMLLAGLVETPQGNLYPQLHGPAELVASQREGFIAFVRGIRPAGQAAP